MAARKQLWHPDSVRQKIQASQLVNRLQDNANGKLQREMSTGQIASAKILLDRVVPTLSSSEVTSDVTVKYAVVVPEKQTEEEWAKEYSPSGSHTPSREH